MLEANPTFLGDETAAELIKVFSARAKPPREPRRAAAEVERPSSYVEGATYRRDQLR